MTRGWMLNPLLRANNDNTKIAENLLISTQIPQRKHLKANTFSNYLSMVSNETSLLRYDFLSLKQKNCNTHQKKSLKHSKPVKNKLAARLKSGEVSFHCLWPTFNVKSNLHIQIVLGQNQSTNKKTSDCDVIFTGF